MLSKQLFSKHRLLVQSISKFSMPYRSFASTVKTTDPNSETIVEQDDKYTPTKTIDVAKGTFLVFDNRKTSGNYGMPYEVKEAIVKNSIGILVTYMIESGGIFPMFYVPTTLFALNMAYRVAGYMSKAVDHMELLNCGTKVKVQFKIGGEAIWNIKDIRKGEGEKALVETFVEPYLFPLKIKDKGTFYLYGHGHQAIKDGEIFRAIINGKSIHLD